jgi:hypothetical protein
LLVRTSFQQPSSHKQPSLIRQVFAPTNQEENLGLRINGHSPSEHIKSLVEQARAEKEQIGKLFVSSPFPPMKKARFGKQTNAHSVRKLMFFFTNK